MTLNNTEARRMRTEHEAAEYIGLRARTLQKWRQIGGGPRFVKLGRLVRYRTSDLDEFLCSGERRTTSDIA